MDMSRAAEVAMAALPFAFIAGLSLMRFAQGAERPRAVVDGYLGWAIVSYASAEVLGAFRQIGFLPVFAVWAAADAWLLYRLWCLRARAAAFWRFKISTGLLIVSAIGAVTLFIALTAAPNNWDSQTYHLPRVEHWIQNRSLAFYPTSITRQNEMGPVAEILLLQTRILGGSDVFYPLVQWVSMVCAVAAVFRITRQLGGDEPQCWIAAVFLMTLPIGILESTSTQNDYVVTALLACGVTLGLEAMAEPRPALGRIVAAAAAVGLSGMAKPIGFLFGAGFAVWFAIGLSRRVALLAWLGRAAGVTLVLALAIAPFASRYLATREPTARDTPRSFETAMVNGSFGVRQTVDNLFRHVVANLVTGVSRIDAVTSRAAQSVATALSLDTYRRYTTLGGYTTAPGEPAAEPTTAPGEPAAEPLKGLYIFHEDHAPNLFHTILILVAVGAISARWRQPAPAVRRIYWIAWLSGIVVFTAVLRWGLYSTRYHLPAFALAAPIVATAWPQRWSRSRGAVVLPLLLALSSLPVLMFNQSRELVPLLRNRPLWLRASYLTQSAMERLFVNQSQLLGPYQRAIEGIAGSNASQVGLILGGDSWEYPVWRMLRDRKLDHPVRLEHVNLSGNPRWPLAPFFPDVVFWSLGEGEPPPTLAVSGREFVRIGPPGIAVVYAPTGFAPPEY
jgi:hypothetical protein